jgi:hypothetical protein
MKKSEILKSLKPVDLAKISSDEGYETIEKSQSKYGEGKKKQVVTVKNKSGKTFTRIQEVGVKSKPKTYDLDEMRKKLAERKAKETKANISLDKRRKTLDSKLVINGENVIGKDFVVNPFVDAIGWSSIKGQKVRITKKGVAPDSVMVTRLDSDGNPLPDGVMNQLQIGLKDLLNDKGRLITPTPESPKQKSLFLMQDVKIKKWIGENMNADKSSKESSVKEEVKKPNPLQSKFSEAVEKTAAKYDDNKLVDELSSIYSKKKGEATGADLSRMRVFERELIDRLKIDEPEIPENIEDVDLKSLQKLQGKLSDISFKFHTKVLLSSKDEEKTVFQKLSNRFGDKSYEINRTIRKKIDRNEAKESETTTVEVPLSKSPMSVSKETVSLKVVKKEGGKYAKSGVKTTEHNGFKTGDKIMFNVKGEQVRGTFKHMNVNVHSPNGYYVIRGEDGKLYERNPNTVTKK